MTSKIEPVAWPPLIELGRCLAAFASAVKSGEGWTPALQADYDRANQAMKDEYAALLAAEQRGREAERALLDTFGKNTGLELSWGEIDPTDEGGPCAWLVHERRGNVNDREWHLIAHGDTPAEAIAAAIRKGEGT